MKARDPKPGDDDKKKEPLNNYTGDEYNKRGENDPGQCRNDTPKRNPLYRFTSYSTCSIF